MVFAHQIEIFSINTLPVKADEMEVSFCWLDKINRIEQTLASVSNDDISVIELINEYEQTLMNAMQCQSRASAYGLKKLPAIVIDEQFVAYGLDSVSQALRVLEDKEQANA